jgi:hypothetical protein
MQLDQDMTMKTIAILAAALSLSLTACATDDDVEMDEGGRPPLGKPIINPQTDVAAIDESFELGSADQAPQKNFDDGRLEYVETIGKVIYLHRFNERLGVDEISVLDDNGEIVRCCVSPRGQLTELDHEGVK